MGQALLVWYYLSITLAAVVCTGIGLFAVRKREGPQASSLGVWTITVAIWAGFHVLGMLATSKTWSIRLSQVQWLGTALAPSMSLVFVLYYTGREDLVTPRSMAALFAIPVVVLALVLTNDFHGYHWAAVQPSAEMPGGYEHEHGPAFYLFVLHAYLAMGAATWYLVVFFHRTSGLYRGQAGLIVAGGLSIWLANVLFVTGASSLDLTPVGFAFFAIGLGFAMLRYGLTDVVPVARDTVVDNITDGVVVLDSDDRVVDINPKGRRLLNVASTESLLGDPARSVFPDSLVDHFDDATSESDVVPIESAHGTRYLDVDISPLEDRRKAIIGRLFLVRDVTERRRNRHELERQNEQLDRFASLVSHDLRNPLNVANGYVEVLKSRSDDPAIDEIEQSHDRMERIIEDVLALTRQGQAIDETEEVVLADLAHEAWNYVDTTDATLAVDVPDDHTVQADPSRLVQAFENLYRNAIDHVGSDVAITVGELDSDDHTLDDGRRFLDGPAGFYVEDDGPGIPENEREEVLKVGYTTADDGTGLGLDIVRSIVEAHGWELSVAEAATGGARFVVQYAAAAAWETTPEETVGV